MKRRNYMYSRNFKSRVQEKVPGKKGTFYMSTIDKLIRRQIKLTILSVIAVVLITSTITYALYQTNHENSTDQVISIGNLGLTATGTPITLEGLYPMEEYDLTSSYPSYNFTLENKTNGLNNDYTLMY